MSDPKVSIIMAGKDAGEFLREAIDSIVAQTFADWELIFIDDGSKDNTAEILSSYSNPRIHVVANAQNIGLTKSLNIALNQARGDIIVRADADDVNLPHRLQTIVDFFAARPEVGLLGSYVQVLGTNIVWEHPAEHDQIAIKLLYNNSVFHPSMAWNKKVIGGVRYDESFIRSQDYDLTARVAESYRVANIPEVLVHYRNHAGNISSSSSGAQIVDANRVRARLLTSLGVSSMLVKTFCKTYTAKRTNIFTRTYNKLFTRVVISVNKKAQKYDPKLLASILIGLTG